MKKKMSSLIAYTVLLLPLTACCQVTDESQNFGEKKPHYSSYCGVKEIYYE